MGLTSCRKCGCYNQSTVPILLTGAANFDYAAEFVGKGEVFRLLSKPCPPDKLVESVEDALFHFAQTSRRESFTWELL